MPDFVSLACILRENAVEEPDPGIPAMLPAASTPSELLQTLSEVRRFRAHLRERFERDRRALLREFAATVLARELHLAPCDISRICANVLAALTQETILQIIAHPDDVEALRHFEVPVSGEASIARGGLRIELGTGTVTTSLDARLDDAVRQAH